MKKLILTFCLLGLIVSCSGNKDEKLQKNLTYVWGEYFEKNFDETSLLNVMIVTNRKSKDNLFGCADGKFGNAIDENLTQNLQALKQSPYDLACASSKTFLPKG